MSNIFVYHRSYAARTPHECGRAIEVIKTKDMEKKKDEIQPLVIKTCYLDSYNCHVLEGKAGQSSL